MEIDKEQLKSETKDTVNQVKENLKAVNINEEAKATQGFLKEMLVTPFETVEKVATGEENAFRRAIVLLIIEVAAVVISSFISTATLSYYGFMSGLKYILLSALRTVVAVAVPAIVILVMNRNNKKSLTTILSAIVVARVPSICAAVLGIISAFFLKLGLIISPITTALSALTIVFSFVAMKTLFDEDNEKFIFKFAIIKVITAFVLYLI